MGTKGLTEREDQAGVPLVELLVSLTIIGLITVPLVGVINQFIFIPSRLSAAVTAMNDSRSAVRWIAEDARQATSFTSSTEPDYGTFSWTDRTRFPVSAFSVRYFLAASSTLMRDESVNGVTSTNLITDTILDFGDVSRFRSQAASSSPRSLRPGDHTLFDIHQCRPKGSDEA